jgi:hypothetical protein
VVAVLFASSCVPQATVPISPAAVAHARSLEFGLQGEPDFQASALPQELGVWYERLLAAIEHPDQKREVMELAETGDLYNYGRPINEYLTSVLFAFRVTGDLRLLDEVDRVAQAMRGQLTRQWRSDGGSVSPDDGTRGLRRWLWWYDSSEASLYGRDTHEMDALMTHGLIAAIAYAFEVNRDSESPGGSDYGERADFWVDYLVRDFEAIWRERNGEPQGFPFLRRYLTHPWTSSIRYHHYMGLLTGRDGYRREVEELTDSLMEGQVQVQTEVGPAVVWTHGVVAAGSDSDYLQPTTYVRYDTILRGELALERATPAIDAEHMQQIANALSQFVDDGNPGGTADRFAATIGGDRPRGGVSLNEGWRPRQSIERWAISGWAFAAAWDETGLVDAINDDVFDAVEEDPDEPRRVYIPAAKILTIAVGRAPVDGR